MSPVGRTRILKFESDVPVNVQWYWCYLRVPARPGGAACQGLKVSPWPVGSSRTWTPRFAANASNARFWAT
jgi:hypothetical protein